MTIKVAATAPHHADRPNRSRFTIASSPVGIQPFSVTHIRKNPCYSAMGVPSQGALSVYRLDVRDRQSCRAGV